jgi:hypothetical protein
LEFFGLEFACYQAILPPTRPLGAAHDGAIVITKAEQGSKTSPERRTRLGGGGNFCLQIRNPKAVSTGRPLSSSRNSETQKAWIYGFLRFSFIPNILRSRKVGSDFGFHSASRELTTQIEGFPW